MTEQKFNLTLHYADCCGRAGNCAYPYTVTARTTGDLQKYLGYDHVFIHFQENVRAKDNFVSAATVVFDCDNDHTEDAAAWITPEDIPGLFWDIRCVTATSRHHMKPKGNRTARPRFHVIFPIVPITNPTLTVLLAVQPSVLSGLMQNGNFRGRGLTARFLYCLPTSIVGNRKYCTEPIPDAVALEYDKLIRNLLEDRGGDDITLSAEADTLLEAFSNEVEGKLKQEYAEIQDWAGKLAGTVLRIAGVLCRAGVYRYGEFLDDPAPLVVSGEMMENAIAVGKYFTAHAQAAFTTMGANTLVKNCQYILGAIEKNALEEFNRRDIMRLCRSIKTTGELQPILDHLVDYGCLAPKLEPIQVNKGRPASQSYLVNPCIIKRAS